MLNTKLISKFIIQKINIDKIYIHLKIKLNQENDNTSSRN